METRTIQSEGAETATQANENANRLAYLRFLRGQDDMI